MSKQPTSIAYISQMFPALTETFVYREVHELERKGFRVATFSIWKPNENQLSQESKQLLKTSRYVFPISWPRFIRAHLYFLCTRPGAYLGTLLFVMTRRGESIQNRRRTFLHFCEAIYLVADMKKQGLGHIHAHFSINAATIALVAARLLGITFSFTVHNILFTDRVILRAKANAARFIVAISEFSRNFLIHLYPEEGIEDKIHIVHCGLSPADFSPPESKPAKDIPTVLFVAQLCERKGAPILVEACKLLAERGVAYECVIVGDGPQMSLVKHMVEEYNLHGLVQLAGRVFQEQLKEYLAHADIFVLPCLKASNGDMDGIPVSLMEAMSMEIATVSTYVSGIPELIENELDGLLVPEKNATALADALQRLVADPELRRRLGENGRQKVLREFDIDKSTAQLAVLFERYLRG